jgi:tRNA(Ile)-lysidine synthase
MSLLHALAKLAPELPYKFKTVHVNHRLRGNESDADEQLVAKVSARYGFPVLGVRLMARGPKTGVEEWAREQRYTAFAQIARMQNAPVVLTAHTQDDQTETVLMHMLRGAGTGGLGGMPDWRKLDSGLVIGRPLLNVSKKEILAYLRRFKIPARIDRTNLDEKRVRNWLRHRVVPLFEKRFPEFSKRLASLASLVREDGLFWDRYIADVQARLFRPYRGGWLLDLPGLLRYSTAVQRRVLRRAAGSNLLSYDGVENWRRWMTSPPTSGRIWQLRKGWVVERLSKSKGSPTASLFWLGRHKRKRSP